MGIRIQRFAEAIPFYGIALLAILANRASGSGNSIHSCRAGVTTKAHGMRRFLHIQFFNLGFDPGKTRRILFHIVVHHTLASRNIHRTLAAISAVAF